MRTSPPFELIQFAGRLGQELATQQLATLQATEAENLPPCPPESRTCPKRIRQRNHLLSEKLLAVAGQLALAPQETNLNDWLSHFLKLLRLDVSSAVHIESQIPEEDFIITIDREWLHQALRELLRNAEDAMPNGGRLTLSLQARSLENRPYIAISVTDTGTGMEPALLARAMEPLVTTKEMPQHKGWGLAVCEGFARQSGGWLELESQYHHGTKATLYLPLPNRLFPALHLGA